MKRLYINITPDIIAWCRANNYNPVWKAIIEQLNVNYYTRASKRLLKENDRWSYYKMFKPGKYMLYYSERTE